jgi:hypothetical protein
VVCSVSVFSGGGSNPHPVFFEESHVDLSKRVRWLERAFVAQAVLIGLILFSAAAQDQDNLKVKTLRAESITVKAPGSDYSVAIVGMKTTAGIWVGNGRSDDKMSFAAIYNQGDAGIGPVVAIQTPQLPDARSMHGHPLAFSVYEGVPTMQVGDGKTGELTQVNLLDMARKPAKRAHKVQPPGPQ